MVELQHWGWDQSGPTQPGCNRQEQSQASGSSISLPCRLLRLGYRDWVLGLSCAVRPGAPRRCGDGSIRSRLFDCFRTYPRIGPRANRDASKRHFTRRNAPNWLRIVLLQEFPVNQNLQLRIQEPCKWAKGGLGRIRDCFNCWEQNNRLSKPGHCTSLRRLFAFLLVNECYGDFATVIGCLTFENLKHENCLDVTSRIS
jgi:hypothetical protein